MNAGTWALIGLGLLVLGVVVTFACASRGLALQRSIGMLVDPVATARRHGRVVNVARAAFVAVLAGGALLLGAGGTALIAAIT